MATDTTFTTGDQNEVVDLGSEKVTAYNAGGQDIYFGVFGGSSDATTGLSTNGGGFPCASSQFFIIEPGSGEKVYAVCRGGPLKIVKST